MKIVRTKEQAEAFGTIKLHEVIHESDVNPTLYMPTDTSSAYTNTPDVAYLNEVNSIHASGEFDDIVEESSAEYLFYLKLDNHDNMVELHFKQDTIYISDQSSAEHDALVDIANSLDATLLDDSGAVVMRSKPKSKSFWQRLGF